MTPDVSKAIDLVDWEAVRNAHINSDQTVAEILLQFGVTKDQYYRRARAEGWPSRRQRSHRLTPRDGEPGSRPQTTTEKRAAMAARLFHALEERIMAIEEETSLHDASHGERDAKALTAMARALDTLGEMLEASQSAEGQPKAHQEDIDVDEFRQLLTDRLDRLRASGAGG